LLNHVIRQNKTPDEGSSGLMNEDQWFLEGFKDNTNLGNSFQVSRHFKMKKR